MQELQSSTLFVWPFKCHSLSFFIMGVKKKTLLCYIFAYQPSY